MLKYLVLILLGLVLIYAAYKRKRKFNDYKKRVMIINKYNQQKFKYR